MDRAVRDALLRLIPIEPRDRILEINCGEGELSVELAARVPFGMVAAVDPSEDHIRLARLRGRDLENVIFSFGGEGVIPWKENFFSKTIAHGAPESSTELLRVLAPGGGCYIRIAATRYDALVDGLQAAGFAETEVTALNTEEALIVSKKPITKSLNH